MHQMTLFLDCRTLGTPSAWSCPPCARLLQPASSPSAPRCIRTPALQRKQSWSGYVPPENSHHCASSKTAPRAQPKLRVLIETPRPMLQNSLRLEPKLRASDGLTCCCKAVPGLSKLIQADGTKAGDISIQRGHQRATVISTSAAGIYL